MVKWISRLSSEQLFQVRILVGAQRRSAATEFVHLGKPTAWLPSRIRKEFRY